MLINIQKDDLVFISYLHLLMFQMLLVVANKYLE